MAALRKRMRDLNHAPQDGFTLIELLVVICIISIITALAVFSVTGNSSGIMRQEAERMLGAMQLAADIAQNDGAEIGLTLTKSSYGFVEYAASTGGWKELHEKELRNYTLPDGITLKLAREDKEVALKNSGNASPYIMFYSSGEVTPFAISLSSASQDLSLLLSTDGLSPIKLYEKAQ
jgi:general secretion pathway protein H